MVRPLVILFLLGALQGVVGWIMVASGLTGDAVYVKPTRLALHFVFALVLFCYTAWFAFQLLVPHGMRVFAPPLSRLTWIIVAVFFIQLVFGALMAGLRAAPAAPTWPDINGHFLPPPRPGTNGLKGMLEDRLLIHFIRRRDG